VQGPDKWDEIAEKVLHEIAMNTARGDRAQSATFVLSQALRDAERAGMERAAVIAAGHSCEEAVSSVMSNGGSWGDAAWAAGEDIATAIRAAKETKP
jgi:hypothetical protein